MAKTDRVQRPTITLPPRSSIDTLFTGFSPGPLTLVSKFFSDNYADSDCRSFSQLLAGAMASPVSAAGSPMLLTSFLADDNSSKEEGNSEIGGEEKSAFKQNRPILKHLRLSGKEHSIPYRVIPRAMEDLINEHGLDIEALKSSHVPLTGGTHMGDSSETQLAEEEDTIKTQERQHKKAGVRISIPLDEILQSSKLSRHSAAKKLEVSISTLKRICRDYGIHRWPPRNKNKVRTPRSSSVVRLGEIPQLNPDQPSNQASAGVANTKPHDTTVRNVNVMTVKAKYINDITIKFWVSLPPELVELRQQVAKRLDLEPGTYHIKYKDEDGDLILIGCDEDLQDYIHNSTLQGSTSVTLLLEPK